MDIIEFNRHLGHATPKEMSDNFSKTLAMYCITYGYEAEVIAVKKSNKLFYKVTPKDKASVDYLIDSIGGVTTIAHGDFFKFHAKRFDENSLSVEIEAYNDRQY